MPLPSTELVELTVRVLPGMIVFAGCLALFRGVSEPLIRISILILGFVLLRDTMTPVGIWRFGSVGGVVPWARFVDDAPTLVLLALATVAVVAAMMSADRRLRDLVRWGSPRPGPLLLGVAGGLLAAAPVLAVSTFWPLSERGGPVATGLLPALLFLALAGNLLEEVLFRGFLQGRLEQLVSPIRAAALSAVLFAACHTFLATSVTDVGWPLLLFTLYEGAICALLRTRYGVLASTLAHATAIFCLTSGMV